MRLRFCLLQKTRVTSFLEKNDVREFDSCHGNDLVREQLTTSRLGQHQCLIAYFTWRTFRLKQHAAKNATKVTLVALQILLRRSAVCAEQTKIATSPCGVDQPVLACIRETALLQLPGGTTKR